MTWGSTTPLRGVRSAERGTPSTRQTCGSEMRGSAALTRLASAPQEAALHRFLQDVALEDELADLVLEARDLLIHGCVLVLRTVA